MNTAAELKKIDQDRIERIYSGRSGCMCGCRGDYYEDQKSIKRVLKNMIEYAELNDLKTEEGDGDIFLDDGKKSYCIFLKGS